MTIIRSQSTEFEIAPHIKNTDWQKLNLCLASPKGDWAAGVAMFEKRMCRFLEPVRVLIETSEIEVSNYAGFAILALDCLLIETLQSFRIGRTNPLNGDRLSRSTFVAFLTQRESFKSNFDSASALTFYTHFRCGILHQGEIKSSGLVRTDTPKMVMPSRDNQSLIINRLKFHEALIQEINIYKEELVGGCDVILKKNFIKKMNEISAYK